MSTPVQQVTKDRAARDAARKLFDTRLEQVRTDFSARSVGGRVADRLSADARSALDTAVQIASAEKGVVAGTAFVLALWFLRNPIIAWLADLPSTDDSGEDEVENEEQDSE